MFLIEVIGIGVQNIKILIDNLSKEDVDVIYNKDENKFSVKYNRSIDLVPLCVDIKNPETNKIYYTLSNVILSDKYYNWCVPNEKVYEDTDKVLVSFYEKNKLVDIEIDL
jgi:hypothetical protein